MEDTLSFSGNATVSAPDDVIVVTAEELLELQRARQALLIATIRRLYGQTRHKPVSRARRRSPMIMRRGKPAGRLHAGQRSGVRRFSKTSSKGAQQMRWWFLAH